MLIKREREKKPSDSARGATLTDLSEWLNKEYNLTLPDPKIMAVLNGKGWEQYPDKLDTKLTYGDTVLLFPPIAGG